MGGMRGAVGDTKRISCGRDDGEWDPLSAFEFLCGPVYYVQVLGGNLTTEPASEIAGSSFSISTCSG